MSRTSVDVRSGEATVVVTAEVTDDRSGVDHVEAALMAPPNDYNSLGAQAHMYRVSGTKKYRGEMTIPQGSVGGRWNLEILTLDQVDNYVRYLGPDMYAVKKHDTYNSYLPLPSGGRLDVTGTAVDTSKPVLQELIVERTSIDTLPRPVNVTFDVAGTDTGDGIRQVSISVFNYDNWLELQGYVLAPYTGTNTSGRWRVVVTFPQGTAPGTYWVGSISLFDRNIWGFYSTPGSFPQSQGDLLAPEKYRTTGGAVWDGSITVIENPAG